MVDSGPSQELSSAKKKVRATARLRRSALPDALRPVLAAMAAARLADYAPFEQAGVVMAFASFSHEIDTTPLLRRVLGAGKRLVLPVTVRSQPQLELRLVRDLDALVPGRWDIPEPGPGCPLVLPSDLELVVVPGLAFDERGHRIGYGGGYYDRLLRSIRRGWAPACGLGYEVQVFRQVPAGPDDERLDALVTDAATREFSGGLNVLGGAHRCT